MTDKARILFVDDEKRVLNSMRGLFRRNYELFLTTVGADAVRIASENDVDVVVADQRMPGMTGIEVLGKIKKTSPRTVRILLTGYADPSAVEGSINIGEVFRFLSKPCPPKLLRETLSLAIDAARTEPVVQPQPTEASKRPERRGPTRPFSAAPKKVAPSHQTEPSAEHSAEQMPGKTNVTHLPVLYPDKKQFGGPPETDDASHWHSVTNVIMSEDTIEETQGNIALPAEYVQGIGDVGVVIFTVDAEFAEASIRALSEDRNAILATSLIKVAQALETHKAGVLVTDFTADSRVLKKMINALKRYMPELVTIVVSGARDTTDMINLINYGQIYRYLLKPVEGSQLRNDVNAAAVRCFYMRRNPETIKRHQVIDAPVQADTSTSLNQFLGKIRNIQPKAADSVDAVTK